VFRTIHIVKPGATAHTAALVWTDADEAAVRERVASEGLLAGTTVEVEPCPNMWGYIDYIKRRHNGQA
jgi:hypothetical protein